MLRVDEKPEGFHARYSARSRSYRFTILNRPARPAVGRQYQWHVRHPLDAAALDAALEPLEGTHDFAAFSGASDRDNTVRTLLSASCTREGDRVYIDLTADAFLPHMVRNVVGTLVLVGRGSLEPGAVATILASRDRRRAGPTAPPDGLCLVRVNYGDTPR